MKEVFTTGQAAKICKVSQQTIIRCFDNGQLKGFRVPGSKFRRIPREALIRFMKENDIPLDGIQQCFGVVLLDDQSRASSVTEVLQGDRRFASPVVVESDFHLAMAVNDNPCNLLFVAADRFPVEVILPRVLGCEKLKDTKVVVLWCPPDAEKPKGPVYFNGRAKTLDIYSAVLELMDLLPPDEAM